MKNRSLEIVILAAALCASASVVHGQALQAENDPLSAASDWVYLDGMRDAPWVSLGDEGGQVFAHFPAPCCVTRSQAVLFSGYATSASPVWSRMTRRYQPGAVASAGGSDVHVSAAREAPDIADPGPVHVWRWDSSDNQPDWVYKHSSPSSRDPTVGISRDGSLVVVAISRPAAPGEHDVVLLDGATGIVLTQTLVVPALASAKLIDFAYAADGRFVALRLGNEAIVVDVLAGTVDLQWGGFASNGAAIGLSADGGVMSLAEAFVGEVRLVERTGATWQVVYTWSGATQASSVVTAVSDDGSTVATAFGTYPFPGSALWYLALDVPTRAETLSEIELLCCGIGFGPADIDITPDGKRFVVGSRGGDDFDAAQRVAVYARDQSAALATFETGTANLTDVAISPDGRRVAVGGSYADGGGLVHLFTLPGADFRVEGAPQLGTAFDFVLDGSPGQAGVLLLALAPAVPPVVLPGNGTLYLDPLGLQLRPMGAVLPDGSARLTIPLPNLPVLLGVAVWTQGLLSPELQLSDDWHKLTLLP